MQRLQFAPGGVSSFSGLKLRRPALLTVQDIVPLQNRYMKILHTELCLCNTLVECTAGICRCFFAVDGTARTAQEMQDWLGLDESLRTGWDLYNHLMDVLGRTVGDPGMTGFVGEQPAVVMKNGGKKR